VDLTGFIRRYDCGEKLVVKETLWRITDRRIEWEEGRHTKQEHTPVWNLLVTTLHIDGRLSSRYASDHGQALAPRMGAISHVRTRFSLVIRPERRLGDNDV